MKEKVIKHIEELVDKSNKVIVDRITWIFMIVNSILAIYLLLSALVIVKTPIIEVHSPVLYSYLFISTIGIFYFSMLADKLSKPVNRPKLYFFITVLLSIITYCLISEIFNYTITSIINRIIKVADVPNFLVHTNVRLVTVFLPILIVVITFNKSFKIPFIKEYKNQLLEYQIDLFTRNVDKITDYTVDLKLCEDIETGKPVMVSEKVTFRHKLISGSSGSGKTALSIRPDLAQIFYKKAFFREGLKKLTYEALEEGLCYINKPITNKFLNDNFSMEHISIYDDKRELFMNKFKNYIVGVRKSAIRMYSETHSFNGKNDINLEIPIVSQRLNQNIKLTISIFTSKMIKDEIKINLNSDYNEVISKEDFNVIVSKQAYTKKIVNLEGFEEEVSCEKDGALEYISLIIKPTSDNYSIYSFEVNVDEKGDGKIVFRDVGVCVIAPDGGLSKDTCEIAEENGVKVYKIDPKMEEIEKGNIAKLNPLLVGSPEKAGDIVSSILVAMEQTSGKDGNPYFTNASIRAVRNIIILLKVMYPILNEGKQPILTDALDMLNNFNLVKVYVEKMKQDTHLRVRWKTVIDYFETSFYPQPKDFNGKPISDTHIGKNTEKTQQAIGGMINQLDNFLGREEIKYIFCDRENSIDLSKVLENGECIAVSTRQSELGDVLGKAFALMIILCTQNAVLGRYSEDENPEIPFHLFIDEFPFYINDQSKVFFTFCRKYKTSCTVAVQNLSQLEEVSKQFREVLFTNCTTKLVLPGANVEDREYFCKFFGVEEKFDVQTSISSNPVITENAKYSESMRGGLKEMNKISQQDLGELKFKRCFYSTIDPKGNTVVGKGYMDFLKLTEHNTIKPKQYNFEQFLNEELIDLEDKNLNSADDVTKNKENELDSDNANILEVDNIDDNEVLIDDLLKELESDVSKSESTENKISKESISSDEIELIDDIDLDEIIDFTEENDIEPLQEDIELNNSSVDIEVNTDSKVEMNILEISSTEDKNNNADNTIEEKKDNNLTEEVCFIDEVEEFDENEYSFDFDDSELDAIIVEGFKE